MEETNTALKISLTKTWVYVKSWKRLLKHLRLSAAAPNPSLLPSQVVVEVINTPLSWKTRVNGGFFKHVVFWSCFGCYWGLCSPCCG